MVSPGRNLPCPCGSGKKYKKCCWLKDLSEANRLYRLKRPWLDKESRKEILNRPSKMPVVMTLLGILGDPPVKD